MSQSFTSEQTNAVLAVLARSPDGVTSHEIREALPFTVDERTLQRWLAQLREEGRVLAGRSGREFRYLLAVVPKESEAPTQRSAEGGAPVESKASALPSESANAGGPVALPQKAEGASPSAIEIAGIFAGAVPRILGSLMPRLSAIGFLEVEGRKRGWAAEDTRRLAEYGKTRLETLTADEAAACGVDREQYEKWRAQYLGGSKARLAEGGGGVAPAPERLAESLPEARLDRSASEGAGMVARQAKPKSAAHHPAARSEPSTSTASDPDDEPDFSAPVAKPSSVARPVSAMPTGAAITPAELASLAEPLHLAELRTSGFAAVKATITRARAVVALVCGMAIYVASQQGVLAVARHAAASSQRSASSWISIVGYLAVPASGLPWLYFRWRDRVKQGTKLDGIDLGATLLIGGLATLFAAKLALSVVDVAMNLVR